MIKYELLIVGAGPAGISAAINAAHNNISHLLIDKNEIASSIKNYFPGKIISDDNFLPTLGPLKFKESTKEEMLTYLLSKIEEYKVNFSKDEFVSFREADEGNFEIKLQSEKIIVKKIIFASGFEKKENSDNFVKNSLENLDEYHDLDIIIIGNNDCAIEASLELCRSNRIYLLNPFNKFYSISKINEDNLLKAISQNKIKSYNFAKTIEILDSSLTFQTENGLRKVEFDEIFSYSEGEINPNVVLNDLSLELEKGFSTNISNIYMIGSLTGFLSIKHAYLQGFLVIEELLEHRSAFSYSQFLADYIKEYGTIDELKKASKFFTYLNFSELFSLLLESKFSLKQKDEVIFQQGDSVDSVYIILSGLVSFDNLDFILNESNIFGELNLLNSMPRTETARMREAGILLEIPRKTLLKNYNNSSLVYFINQSYLANFSMCVFDINSEDYNSLFEYLDDFEVREYVKNDAILIKDSYVFLQSGLIEIRGMQDIQRQNISYYFQYNKLLNTIENENQKFQILANKYTRTLEVKKKDLKNYIDNNKKLSIDNENLNVAKALVIDAENCIACSMCEKACSETHDGNSWLSFSSGMKIDNQLLITSCLLCKNPLCMSDCPTNAIHRKSNGRIYITDNCVNCGNCVSNCPYDVIQSDESSIGTTYVPNSNSWQARVKKLFGFKQNQKNNRVFNCDLCEELLNEPPCVNSCPTGAIKRVHSSLLEIL